MKLLKVEDIMELFGMSKNTAYNLMHKKDLKPYKIGNKLYVNECDVITYIQELQEEYYLEKM